jgi:hypothetical protein
MAAASRSTAAMLRSNARSSSAPTAALPAGAAAAAASNGPCRDVPTPLALARGLLEPAGSDCCTLLPPAQALRGPDLSPRWLSPLASASHAAVAGPGPLASARRPAAADASGAAAKRICRIASRAAADVSAAALSIRERSAPRSASESASPAPPFDSSGSSSSSTPRAQLLVTARAPAVAASLANGDTRPETQSPVYRVSGTERAARDDVCRGAFPPLAPPSAAAVRAACRKSSYRVSPMPRSHAMVEAPLCARAACGSTPYLAKFAESVR